MSSKKNKKDSKQLKNPASAAGSSATSASSAGGGNSLSRWLESNRGVLTIILLLVASLGGTAWYAIEQRADARSAATERDAARRERDAAEKKAEQAEKDRLAAIADRNKARELHPILAAFGPDVWAYRRYAFKRKSNPVTIPVPTFAGGPTYTLRFVGFSEDASGTTQVEGEWDSDRPTGDRPTARIRLGGEEKQVPLVAHFGMTAKPGCRTLLGESEVAVEAIVERVNMDGVELGIAAHPNPEPKERSGKQLSSLLSDCPDERVGASAKP